MKEKITKLIDLRSIVTLLMNIALVIMLFYSKDINKEILMMFSTSYGSVMTYYFTRKKDDNHE